MFVLRRTSLPGVPGRTSATLLFVVSIKSDVIVITIGSGVVVAVFISSIESDVISFVPVGFVLGQSSL